MADLGMFPRLLGVVLSPISGLCVMIGIGAVFLPLGAPHGLGPAAWLAISSIVLVVPAAVLAPGRNAIVAFIVAVGWLASLVWVTVPVGAVGGAVMGSAFGLAYVAFASRAGTPPENWPILRWLGLRNFFVGYLGIAVTGLVAAFLIAPRTTDCGDMRPVKVRADIGAISETLELFRSLYGRYPTEEEGLRILLRQSAQDERQPLLDLDYMPLDPWGNDYVYSREGDSFRVRSLGADGLEGGEGADADIDSDVVLADR